MYTPAIEELEIPTRTIEDVLADEEEMCQRYDIPDKPYVDRPDGLYLTSEVAEMLGITMGTATKCARRGVASPVRSRKYYFWTDEDIRKLKEYKESMK